ncbi:MAG: NAD(P)-binding domain-containing protein [Thiolinea sp.]
MNSIGSIGFIGVGDLAEYTIQGLRGGGFAGTIYLCPRNRKMSAHLAATFDCEVLESNQAVADASECLIISTRPTHCLDALKVLSFQPGQLLVSVVAGMQMETLREVVPEDVEIVRTMPVNSAKAGASPTLVYPAHAAVEALFDYCGDSISVDTEGAFDQGSVLACVYTWYFSLFEQLIQSTSNELLPADKARQLVLGMAKGAASLALQKTETPGEIAEAIATEGTFSKLGLDILKEQDAFKPWDEACELLIQRMSYTANPQ